MSHELDTRMSHELDKSSTFPSHSEWERHLDSPPKVISRVLTKWVGAPHAVNRRWIGATWFWLPIFPTKLVRGLSNKQMKFHNKGAVSVQIAPLLISQPRNQNQSIEATWFPPHTVPWRQLIFWISLAKWWFPQWIWIHCVHNEFESERLTQYFDSELMRFDFPPHTETWSVVCV